MSYRWAAPCSRSAGGLVGVLSGELFFLTAAPAFVAVGPAEVVIAAGDFFGNEAGGVGEGDWAVVGVGVGGPLLGIREVHQRVDGDEAADS